MIFSDDIDRLESVQIASMQNELLRNSVEYAYNRSPYYKAKLNTMGVNPKNIKNRSDINILPTTSKEDIQKDNWSFLCVPGKKVAEIVSTTGTTGAPIFFAMTRNDIERVIENEKRCFSFANVTDNDCFLLTVTLDNLFIAGMAYYGGISKLGAGVIRLGPCNPQRQLELIKELKPTGLVAVPSFMLAILKEMEKQGIQSDSISLKKAMLIGESIREIDLSNNTLGNMLKSKNCNIEYYSTYGITEAAVAFCECPYQQGFHSHPDLIFVEVLDAEGNQLNDGEVGELVLTTFGVEGMPLLRYRTGDITFKMSDNCKCGRTSVRIGPIIGRTAHKLKLKGTTVYPKTIENAIINIKGVDNYVIEAYTGENQADHILVRIGSYNGKGKLEDIVRERIRARARVTPQVEVVSPDFVKNIIYKDGKRKPATFINRGAGRQ